MSVDKNLIATVTIHQYIRAVKVAEKRRANHYKKGEKLPLKYSEKIGVDYEWKNDVLTEIDTQEKVVKNPKSAGTPRWKVINGQELHQLTLTDYDRSKIIGAIKAQLIPEVEKLDPITNFPIRILCEAYDTFYDEFYDEKKRKNIQWDIDNRYLMILKCFPDVLQGSPYIDKETKTIKYKSKRIIPDDHRKYITQPPVALFYPIENSEDRKLVFKIYTDERDCIKTSKHYGKSE